MRKDLFFLLFAHHFHQQQKKNIVYKKILNLDKIGFSA